MKQRTSTTWVWACVLGVSLLSAACAEDEQLPEPYVYDLTTASGPPPGAAEYQSAVDVFNVTQLAMAPPHERPMYINHPVEIDIRVDVQAEPFQTETWVGLSSGDDFCVVDRIEAHHVQEAYDMAVRANRSLERHDEEYNQALSVSMVGCDDGVCEAPGEVCLDFLIPGYEGTQKRCSTPSAAGYTESVTRVPRPVLTPADITGTVDTEIVIADLVALPEACSNLVGKSDLEVWMTFDPVGETLLPGREVVDDADDIPEPDSAGEMPAPDPGETEEARIFAMRQETTPLQLTLADDPGPDVALVALDAASAVVVLDPDARSDRHIELSGTYRVDGALADAAMGQEPTADVRFTMRPLGEKRTDCTSTSSVPADAPAMSLQTVRQVELEDGVYTVIEPEDRIGLSRVGTTVAHAFSLHMDESLYASVYTGALSCWDDFEVVGCIEPLMSEASAEGLGVDDNCRSLTVRIERVIPDRLREDSGEPDFDEIAKQAEAQMMDDAVGSAMFGGCSEQLVREYSEARARQRELEEIGRFSNHFIVDSSRWFKHSLAMPIAVKTDCGFLSWTGNRDVWYQFGERQQKCYDDWLARRNPSSGRDEDTNPEWAFRVPGCDGFPDYVKAKVPAMNNNGHCHRQLWSIDGSSFYKLYIGNWLKRLTNDPAEFTDTTWNALTNLSPGSKICARTYSIEAWEYLVSEDTYHNFHTPPDWWHRDQAGKDANELLYQINHNLDYRRWLKQTLLAPSVVYTTNHKGEVTFNADKRAKAERLRSIVIPNLCQASVKEQEAKAKFQQIANNCHYVSKPIDNGEIKTGRFIPALYQTLSMTTSGLKATLEAGLLNDYLVSKTTGKFRIVGGPQARIYLEGDPNNPMTKDFEVKDILRVYALGHFYSDAVNSYLSAGFHVLTHDLWKIEFKLQKELQLPQPPPITKEKEKCKYFWKPPMPVRLMVCVSFGGEVGIEVGLQVDGIGVGIEDNKPSGLTGTAKPYTKIFASATAGVDYFIGKAGLKLSIDPIVLVSFPITVGIHWTLTYDTSANRLGWSITPSFLIENEIDLFGGNVAAFATRPAVEAVIYKWDPTKYFKKKLYEITWTVSGTKGL